ncbi:MAG: RloB domain-containing protein [Phycicoccus sp.]|nr:RloB domain-containing protein [Phycicoccus sp.]
MAKERGRARRSRPKRQTARRILVVAEGTRTEPQYVERLNTYLRSKASTTIVKPIGVGKDPLRVVERCVELRDAAAGGEKAYDDCVCLVDVDQHSTLEGAARLASREGIILLISNVKFEVWLRWHAEDQRSALTSSQLDDRTEKLKLITNKLLALHFPFGAVEEACRVARLADPQMESGRKGPNPSSAMPILVDLMLGGESRP